MTKPCSHTCMLLAYVRHSHRYYLPWVTFRKYGTCNWQQSPSQVFTASLLAKFWGQRPKRAGNSEWFGIFASSSSSSSTSTSTSTPSVIVIVIIIIIIASIMCTYPGPKFGIPASAMSGQCETKTQFPESFLSKYARGKKTIQQLCWRRKRSMT